MAVSKRTRYEVLRRDENQCRYCHSTENPLTVDHVTPVALGGTDDPSNLVAACKDCNAGKSSASPDSSLVADVKEDALRHAELIRQAYAVLVQRMGERDDYIDEFAEAYTYQPLPSDWRNSIARWFEMGVPIELIVDAAQIACSRPQSFRGDGRFSYMCGIVWNQVHAVNEAASARLYIDGAFMTESDLTEERFEAYEMGETRGLRAGRAEFALNDVYHQLLTNVCEGSFAVLRAGYESAAPVFIKQARDGFPEMEASPW